MDDRFKAAETDRRTANMIRYGEIVEADYQNARVKIKSGDQVTGWVPWVASRAGTYQDWSPPEVGQQVVLACPDGPGSILRISAQIYNSLEQYAYLADAVSSTRSTSISPT